MVQITSREELEEWLKDKPADWAQVIALRSVLRVMPLGLFEAEAEIGNKLAFAIYRALIMSWIAISHSNYDVENAIRDAHGADYTARLLYGTHSSFASADVAFAADNILRVIKISNKDVISYAGITIEVAMSASSAAENLHKFPDLANKFMWENIENDCRYLLESYKYNKNIVKYLSYEKLWKEKQPFWFLMAIKSIRNNKDLLDGKFLVWMDWLEGRVAGNARAFEIIGDVNGVEDDNILAKLVEVANVDFWDKGATYVNTTLQRWIDEARGRVRQSEAPDEPPSPTPEAIRAVAAEIASPSVTLTNNQLDVIANTTFDGQTDAANLDEAIAVLRAVVGALLGGLPGNAPRSFAANLTIYDGELAKRDAKPFLGVLVRMEKSVSAGFHADPEMFDAGVTTNFESYFDAHLAFLTHYRRNEEREAKIAQFSIDDAAASGVALTGPIDEVVKEVDALAEQGLVTDGFVQAIKEQQAINYEVALYTSSMPTISGEPTVKKRLILQIVGILERALAVVNNLVSATAQYGAFVKVVKQAIAELLKFFI